MDKQERDRIDLERIELFFIWTKASKVLSSCKTEEQLKVAKRYIKLASKRQEDFQRRIQEGVNK